MAEPRKTGSSEGRESSPGIEGRVEGKGKDESLSRPQQASGPLGRRADPSNPFAIMRGLLEDMDRLFGNIGGYGPVQGLGREMRQALQAQWAPTIDVREKGDALIVTADLPGLEAKDLDVRIDDDVLTISGERRNTYEGEEGGVYHSERSYGRFERRIALPIGTDPNAIDAKFENGVLEISAPLPKERGGRRIEVSTGGGRPSKGPPH